MTQNVQMLTRADLYDMVWSRPMTKVAQDFGISDVALAKRCRAVDVPVPPRGYWARVAAGQTPEKIPLPRYRNTTVGRQHPRDVARTGEEPKVEFGLPSEKPSPPLHPQAIAGTLEVDIPLTTDLAGALPVTRRLAKQLKLPGRGAIPFRSSEHTGAFPHVDVSSSRLYRALCFLDTLLRAAATLGWQLIEVGPDGSDTRDVNRLRDDRSSTSRKPRVAALLVDGEPLGFHIEERHRYKTREPTAAEKRRMGREYGFQPALTNAVPTGHLRFIREATAYPTFVDHRTWYDRGNQGIETKIGAILAEMRQAASEVRARRLQHDKEERQREDRERRAAELARRRELNQALIAQLERQAGAWHRARYLRRYVRAARRTQATDWHVDVGGAPTAFLDWAERYVDQLDPLTEAPRDPDVATPHRTYAGIDEHALRDALMRLTGAGWESAWTIAAAPSDDNADVEAHDLDF